MRINSVAAALGAAMLAGKAYAEDVKDDTASSASSVAPQLPTFTVCSSRQCGRISSDVFAF